MRADTSKLLINQESMHKLVNNTIYALSNKKVVASMMIFSMLTLDVPMMRQIEAADVDPALWVTVPIKADPMMQGLTIPADATTKGMWSNVKSWPLNGLHAAVLPDGKVLSYGSTPDGFGQNGRYFDLWDPTLGFGSSSHQTTYRAQMQDTFCTTATYLTNGDLLVSGGNGGRTSTIYTPSNNTLQTSANNMALERWYATMIVLPDSRPIILGGMKPYSEDMRNDPNLAIAQGTPSMTPEILESTGWRSLFGAYSRDAFGPDYLRTSYPRAFVAPNGEVFGISADKMWYLNPNGNGSINVVGNFKGPYSATSPVNVGSTNNAVMFAPGKILVLGGNGGYNEDPLPASNMATVVDINGVTPVLIEQTPMTHARRMSSSIVLANGQVVVTGGSKFANNNGASSVFAAEIWDSNTGTWTVGANAAIYRGYHSNSALMPNGAILSLGGGTPGPVNNVNAEIYYPPYLFKAGPGGATLAARPAIQAISGLSYNHESPMQMDMTNSNPISGLVLIGLSNGTHAFNSGQRRIPLTFSQQENRLTTTIPNANLTPPGYYQVVALDANGVPSLGTIVAIGQNVAPPNVPTTPYNPPDIGGTINAPIINSGNTASYTVSASTNTTYSWNFGDGSPDTPYSADPAITHTFAQPGVYVVTLSARDSVGAISRRTFLQAVATTKTANSPTNSSPIVVETRAGNPARIWSVDPDNDKVSVLNSANNELIASIGVGLSPRNVAIAPDGRIWVTNKKNATISIISPTTLAVVQTITLPRASQPHGLAFDPTGTNAFVVLEALGKLVKLNATTGATVAEVSVAPNVRHVAINHSTTQVLVSRFVSPPALGENTATVNTANAGGEVYVVNPSTMVVNNTIKLIYSDKADSSIQGGGLPNYLAAPVISPDGTTAWVPSKQDNIKRGLLRNGLQLDFQNTVRAISSRINMSTLAEDFAKRIDHDNSSVGSAAVYHPSGVYMFVALETSRQVAVVDAIGGRELFRLEVGRAPQGLALSQDGRTLYVHEFMDRSVSIFDLGSLLDSGKLSARLAAVTFVAQTEKLSANVILGKQLFYDAKDTRLSRDSYMSCASCHNDGGQDGRVWDLTGFGEGLRNTIALNGRAGMGHGFLHWSANFDEVQDFERQIRELSGGTGLMSDAQYSTGTRNQPLGDAKAGISQNLDELAAYVSSLSSFDETPYRDNNGALTAEATAGKALFQSNNCASCHDGSNFTISNNASTIRNIGTIKPSSGNRLNNTLSGIDVPTLRDVWATAPYLHDGSASTLNAAILAHNQYNLTAADVNNLVTYVQQIGAEENVATSPPSSGTGLNGVYYPNSNLSGSPVLQTVGNIFFDWGNTSPAAALPVEAFSARWTGYLEATVSGTYQLQTNSDDGVRVYLNNQLIINNWTDHGPTLDTSATFNLSAGQRIPITVEYFENWGGAVMQLFWRTPDASTFSAVPTVQLYSDTSTPAPSNVPPTVSMTSPVAGASFVQGNPITVSANAADSDGTITQVQFYDGATLIGTDTAAPYSISWTNATVGSHSITARATDNSNAATTSAAVSITVTETPAPSNVPPTVSMTSPVAGASFVQGNPITVSANAADSDGTITQVQFYDGATLIGTDTAAPYSISWTNATVGSHSITARATDNSNAATTSAAVSITVTSDPSNPSPPSSGTGLNGVYYPNSNLSGSPVLQTVGNIFFDWGNTSPAAALPVEAFSARWTGYLEATVSGTYQLQTNSDDGVRVYLNNQLIINNWTDHGPTLDTSATFNLSAGQRIPITVEYFENWGGAVMQLFWRTPDASTFSAVPTVQLYSDTSTPAPSNVPPTVSMTSPVAGASFVQGNPITVSANAADSDGTITQVQFYDGATLIGTDTAAPYSISWTNATVGSHSITARATDNSNAATTSAAVSITVTETPAPSNVPPTVSMTSPVAGASFVQGNPITVSANAADSDGTITQVQFYDGATLIGTDTAAPYSISWTNATVGSHSITARATDNSNAATTSAAVSITVTSDPSNPSPPSSGTGLNGVYYPNSNLSGSPVLQTVGNIFFDWGNTSPAAALPVEAFSARWTGYLEATVSGTYQLQTNSDDGVRVYLNNQLIINNWTDHGPTLDTSATFNLSAGQRIPITVEYFENWGGAVMQLFWRTPDASTFSAVPTVQLYSDTSTPAPSNVPPTVSMTSPVAGASFVQGNPITVSANAADSDGTITQVQFYDGATLIGTDTAAPYSISWTNATVGSHSITARATDNSNAATTSAAVSITVTSDPSNPSPPSSGTGLNGVYYPNSNLSGSPVLQTVGNIFFDWGNTSPAAALPVEAFSARWTGYLEATVSGTYQLQTNSDDGVRVYLNNQLIINNWTDHGPTLDTSATFNLSAGQRIPITVEYFENWGGAVMQLFWRTPDASTFSAVPTVQLYSSND